MATHVTQRDGSGTQKQHTAVNAMVAEFASADDFLGYVEHPRHLEFVSVLVEYAAEAVRTQFES